MGMSGLIKNDLTRRIVTDTGLERKIALSVINSIIKVTTEAIAKGDIVQVVGFGTFVAKKRMGRVVTIPLTNSRVKIPTAKTIKFIAGKRFIESVNKKR